MLKTHPNNSVPACRFQTVSKFQTGKASQGHVANLENVPELLKTFTFTTAMSNLQYGQV
jgi:hypothetical protein